MLELQMIGNLGQDAKLQEYNGRKFVSFSVAHDDSYMDANGNKVQRTSWVSCTINGDGGGLLPYLKAGQKVFVRGSASINMYTDRDGRPAAALRATGCRVELCGQAAQRQEQPVQQTQAQQTQQAQNDVPF